MEHRSPKRRRIDLRLVCAYDDDLHPGLVGLVAGLRGAGYEPEVIVARAGCSRHIERTDLLIVCRGPSSALLTGVVRDLVARVESGGGGVITLDLAGDLASNVARVHQCASLRLVVAALPECPAADDRPSGVVGTIEVLTAPPLAPADAPGVSAGERPTPWAPRHVVWVRAQPPAKRERNGRADDQRPSLLTILAVGGIWLLAAGLLFAGEGTITLDELARLPPAGSGAASGLSTVLDRPAPSPAPRLVPRATPSASSTASEPYSGLEADRDVLIAVKLDPQRQPIAFSSPSPRPPSRASAPTDTRPPPTGRDRRRAHATMPATESRDAFFDTPVAESPRCRDLRRRTTDARLHSRWEEARVLLDEKPCWPASEIRVSLLNEVESAQAKRTH